VARGYRVVVEYREPSYELRLGSDRVYTISYDVLAEAPGDAVRLGLDEFHSTVRLSSVGWSREVRRAFAVPMTADEEQRAEFVSQPRGEEKGPPGGKGVRRRKPRVA
jgi:hypothetical protein